MVSCIMPTANRPSLIGMAIRCFQRQTHADRELIIMDNGSEPIEYLIPNAPGYTYCRSNPSPLGHGWYMNEAVEHAHGEILCVWDDDDWSDDCRIEAQLFQLREASVTGFHTIPYYDMRDGKSYKYIFNGNFQYACGSSQMFRRDFWEKNRFEEKCRGADSVFAFAAAKAGRLLSYPDGGLMVARTHEQNTWKPPLGNVQFPAVPRDQLPKAFWEALDFQATESLCRQR